MTTIILGLDGLDGEYVRNRRLLGDLGPKILQQDFQGANALFTYRIWPSIFAGANNGASDDKYAAFEPETPYIWDYLPATVLLAPVERPPLTLHSDAFPDQWMESYAPYDRLQDTLDRLDAGISAAMADDVPLVVACTRIPDIVSHHLPDEADEWINRACVLADRWCKQADDYLVVSDHGFDYENFGASGLAAHTRRATFASSFCDYDTMTGFCEGWTDDLDAHVRETQLAALGYV